ncbi:MAG: chromate transporter [Eubacterium sp.]|nr:chromate transporter [Eubacterium sp.]
MIYLDLLIGFLEVGLFSFGGAYAAIPLIRDVVLSRGWLDDEMIANMIAISESTPGPFMVNMATYVGSVKGGVLGALVATFAVVLPAFIIILILMVLLKKLLQNKYVKATLDGLKACIIGIILATGLYMLWQNCFMQSLLRENILAIIIALILLVIYYGARKIFKKDISPVGLIGISALIGIVVYGI